MNVLQKKGDKLYLALLVYRSTTLYNGYSPAELLMKRKIRMNVPSSKETSKPQVADRKLVVEKEEEQKWKLKANFDQHHKVWDLLPTPPGYLV